MKRKAYLLSEDDKCAHWKLVPPAPPLLEEDGTEVGREVEYVVTVALEKGDDLWSQESERGIGGEQKSEKNCSIYEADADGNILEVEPGPDDPGAWMTGFSDTLDHKTLIYEIGYEPTKPE